MTPSPEEKRAALHTWLKGLTAEPPEGVEKAKEYLELAGDLYDEDHLDGEQYAAVYELGRALKQPGAPSLGDLARRCLKVIS
ncbi:MAG TPA: hypothetical protein VNM14_23215 [Planctomycetota bacterium]|nr:hypothetical protein [Planctomycetota bacterium]